MARWFLLGNMNYIQTPAHSLPTFPDWNLPQLDGLSTPSLTAVALARAHETLLAGIARRSANVSDHAADLATFAQEVRRVDSTHGFGGSSCL